MELGDLGSVRTLAELAEVLRRLRRRDARLRGDSQLTYRELAARTGWAHSMIGDYFAGKTLPPTDRFDVLVGLLGATPAEVGALATARDRVEDGRRTPTAPVARPWELPRLATAFTGREEQLAVLDALADGSGGAVVISAVSGTAGVGKTALALRWAHGAADRFPDGCLHADLRGYGPERPVAPEAVLARFLRALGVPAAELPTDLAELSARYRSLLAGRRLLVVLDNARSAGQVRPLLPGAASCVVLVTSRDRLTGLVARDGAHRVSLDLLSAAEAVALLRRLIGPRASASPDAVAALAERCARLPLALRMAAELATARPAVPLESLVAELGARPLDLFDADGDPETAAREIFGWSYRHLSPEAARLFRRLGAQPGPDVDAAAAAVLVPSPPLDELVRAHLLGTPRPGRYDLHDLLRAYAAELAGPDDLAAVDRFIAHQVTTAEAAVVTLHTPSPSPAPSPALFATSEAALRWLDDELPNLVAVAESRPAQAGALSAILWRYLDSGGHHVAALALHERARRAAADAGDAAAEAAALGELGRVHSRVGNFDQAIDHLTRALAAGAWADQPDRSAGAMNSLAIVHARLGRFDDAGRYFAEALAVYRRTGNRASAGKALGNLGIVNAELGRYPVAVAHFEQALDLARAVGDRTGEGEALGNLAHVNALLGRLDAAVRRHHEGLVLVRAAGDRAAEGRMLASLGAVLTRLGHPDAGPHLHSALTIAESAGDRAAGAEALSYLGTFHLHTGAPRQALDHQTRSLAAARAIGDRSVETMALIGLGHALLALARPHDAIAHFTEALTLATTTGDRHRRAQSLDGLAHSHHAAAHPAEAAIHRAEADAAYASLGLPPPTPPVDSST
ncbi:MAG TPA: tetratricopeptide repeat protein [Pseudonocardiaceae bacterium]